MPTLRDLLDRFRRGIVPPGPALTRVAPPVDRRVLVEAELADVFATVDATSAVSDRQVAEAERLAAAATADARAAADDLLRRTDRQLGDIRAAAASERRNEVDAETSRIAAAAEEERARIQALAGERIPELATRVMAHIEGAGD